MSELRNILLTAIRPNPVALRQVNKDTESYQGLVDSIRNDGVLNSITVRLAEDPESEEEYYELVDGLHRFTASCDASTETIPAQIIEATDAEVLYKQIVANAQKVETKPSQYAESLRRILSTDSLLTEAELAAKLGKSSKWIGDILGLNKIVSEEISELINEGIIGLSNAYALAKLPQEEQENYKEEAVTMKPDEFVPLMSARAKEIAEAKRKGQKAAPAEFIPIGFMRKLKELKEVDGVVASQLVAASGVTDVAEAVLLGVQFAINLDPISIGAQRDKFDAKQADKADKAEKRDAVRAEKKAEKDQARVAKLKAKADVEQQKLDGTYVEPEVEVEEEETE